MEGVDTVMKKTIAILLSVLLLAAVGCGKKADGDQPKSPGNTSNNNSGQNNNNNNSSSNGNNSGGNSNSEKKPVEKVDLGPLKEGDSAKVGDVEVKVQQFAVKTKAPGLPAGFVFVLAKVSIINNGQVDYPINLTEHFKFYNAEGKTYVMNSTATNQEKQRLTGTVPAGKSAEGFIGYMVKKADGTNKFVYQHPDWGKATWQLSF
jgi:hypothetical protein